MLCTKWLILSNTLPSFPIRSFLSKWLALLIVDSHRNFISSPLEKHKNITFTGHLKYESGLPSAFCFLVLEVHSQKFYKYIRHFVFFIPIEQLRKATFPCRKVALRSFYIACQNSTVCYLIVPAASWKPLLQPLARQCYFLLKARHLKQCWVIVLEAKFKILIDNAA